MSHHVNGQSSCPLCSEKIAEGHPKLQDIWNKIKSAFPDCHISWCFRNEKDQNRFYEEGKTRCLWPHSKHNVMKDDQPMSQAMDLFQISLATGAAWFLPEYYLKISDFLDSENLGIEWSGRWTQGKEHFSELDHFQLMSEMT